MGFDDFVVARGLALKRFAYVLCGDAHQAEDLVQGALERTYVRWRKGGVLGLEAYVRQAIVRGWISSQRLRSTTEVPLAAPPETVAGDRTANSDERDRMWRQLARLPSQQRAVLVLGYYEDLTDAGIASQLGCSRGTVRSSRSRALASLRANFAAMEGKAT